MDVAYRLYPETHIVGMVGDAKYPVAWLKANAARYAVAPQRIVLGGASAGGHIALLAAYTNHHPELTPVDLLDVDCSVRGALGWYSPVGLRACYEHYENATLVEMMPDEPETLRRRPGCDECLAPTRSGSLCRRGQRVADWTGSSAVRQNNCPIGTRCSRR
jgi:hypothetical protein